MDIRDEVRAILAAAMPGNDNRPSPAPLRVEVVHSGRVEHVVTAAAGSAEPLFPMPAPAPAGRSNARPLSPARLVLHPAPWVRRMLAREGPSE